MFASIKLQKQIAWLAQSWEDVKEVTLQEQQQPEVKNDIAVLDHEGREIIPRAGMVGS